MMVAICLAQPELVDTSGIEDWMPRVIKLVETELRKKDSQEYERFIKLSPTDRRRYVIDNWSTLEIQPDSACLAKMNSLLHPLLENTLRKEAAEKIAQHFAPTLASDVRSTSDLHLALDRPVGEAHARTDAERVQVLLVSYLNLFAGIYSAQADMLVWVCILGGKKYYRVERGRKIMRRLEGFSEIQKEPIHYKLLYLSNEGFQSFSEAGDKDLRNAVAHGTYDLSDAGDISYTSSVLKKKVTLDRHSLGEKHMRLGMMIACFNKSMWTFYVDWIKRMMKSSSRSSREALSRLVESNLGDLLDDH